MKRLLVVVDYQNDFVDGALGFKGAELIAPAIARLINEFRANKDEVVFTYDTHDADYMNTVEGNNLPVPHCIKGTKGWELVPALAELQQKSGSKVYEKPTFGSVMLAHELHQRYTAGEIASIELVGLCTDICVISNALLLKAAMPELPITVDPACCAGVTPEKHAAALEVMKSCQIGVE